MSALPGGRMVRCDGNECGAMASLPVALRPTLTDTPRASETASIVGWLFAGANGGARHFCPHCISLYLPQSLGDLLGSSAEKTLFESGETR